ncbi:MAG: ActR/PrrA/RegA family redox response regulator transcription factor [Pseudomonadota bacterium]
MQHGSLLIVDDDEALRARLGRAMERRGFQTTLAAGVSEAVAVAAQNPPDYAIVDLRLDDGSGLDVVNALHEAREDSRVVILSGYGNIPNAVAAVKAGAIDYLPKPADADDLEKALMAPDGEHPEPPEHARSADDVRWAHIYHVFQRNNRNVSETARRLGMHRRTLQRMLAKRDLN